MRTLIALLLMTTAAIAQDPIKGTVRNLNYASNFRGAVTSVTAGILLENVTSKQLSVVVDASTAGSIGSCRTRQGDTHPYSGLRAGIADSRAAEWHGGPPGHKEAARVLPAGSKIAVTMKIEQCKKHDGPVDVALPLMIYEADGKAMPVTVTVLDVAVK